MRAVVDDPELLALAGVAPIACRGGLDARLHAGRTRRGVARPTVGSTGLNIDTLTLLVVNGYAAAVVGRLRSLPWTFVGGIALDWLTPMRRATSRHIPAALVEQIATSSPPSSCSSRCSSCRAPGCGHRPHPRPPAAEGANAASRWSGPGSSWSPSRDLGRRRRLTLATISQGIALGIVALSLVLLTGYGGQSRSASTPSSVWAPSPWARWLAGAAPGWGSSPRSDLRRPRHARRTARAPAARPLLALATLASGGHVLRLFSTPRSSPATAARSPSGGWRCPAHRGSATAPR